MNIRKHIDVILALSFFLIIFSGCKKNELPPPTETDIIFLGHKGGGSTGYGQHFENTIPAIEDGIKSLDGVECDIQMSLDSTLWIFHDPDVSHYCCDTSNNSSLIFLHDSEISKISLCYNSTKERIYKLSELIDLWNASSDGFYISLEVKSAWSFAQFSQIGGKSAYVKKVARRMAALLTPLLHKDKMFIETYEKDFCNTFKPLVKGVRVCMLYSGSFANMRSIALKNSFDGISASYKQTNISPEEVKRARDSGLVVQVWTPYYDYELDQAMYLNPTTIQTDNMYAKKVLNVK